MKPKLIGAVLAAMLVAGAGEAATTIAFEPGQGLLYSSGEPAPYAWVEDGYMIRRYVPGGANVTPDLAGGRFHVAAGEELIVQFHEAPGSSFNIGSFDIDASAPLKMISQLGAVQDIFVDAISGFQPVAGLPIDSSVFNYASVLRSTDGSAFSIDNIGIGAFSVGGVPEPATWAMMILGFGIAGTALRYQRRRAALA